MRLRDDAFGFQIPFDRSGHGARPIAHAREFPSHDYNQGGNQGEEQRDTDGIQGLMLGRELELWVQAGIPPEQVLRKATMGAARVARAAPELGSITPGKLADVALFEGNPARTISDIRNPRVVIKDGVVFRS